MLYFEGLTPSPCGHSPYLIYDEQRERIESITLTVFTLSELYGDSPPPLCFAQQNIGEVARSDGGVENDINQFISDISLSFCRVLWHYGELQNSIGIKGYFSILSPCVSVREYRGSARRARGLERWHIVFL